MNFANKISGYNRKRKWELFQEKLHPKQDTKILDVGFTETEYSENDNYLEKHYKFQKNITALGIDRPKDFFIKYPEVKVVTYKGGGFPFSDNTFEICWSNAVLEHVGSREKQIEFLNEIKRVAKAAFITTPNRFFPIEVHTKIPLLHYLPKKIFDRILKLLGRGWAAGDYMQLLSVKELKELLKEAKIEKYEIVKNKIFGITVDFVVIF